MDTAVSAAALHPQMEPLALLLGTWSGEGHGSYPTIENFEYGEEIVFAHVGKPFFSYRQRTWDLSDGRPLHAETGYWRLAGDGSGDGWALEVVLAHPSGIVEISLGTVRRRGDVLAIDLQSSSLSATPTAKEVTGLARRLLVTGDRIDYTLEMAAVGQGSCPHLTASLQRS